MIGRKLAIKKASTLLASVRTKSFSWGGEAVDITTDDSLGKATSSSETGQEQIELSVEGLLEEDTLMTIALGSGSKLLTDLTLEFATGLDGTGTGATIACDFVMTSFEVSGEYGGVVTFSASFSSSGAWTYSPQS